MARGTKFVSEDVLRKRFGDALEGRTNEIAVGAWIQSQPRFPTLVGAKRAAEMFGVPPSHITRLRQSGRMPDAIPVEGGNDVYLAADVRALARELERERVLRAARKAAREE